MTLFELKPLEGFCHEFGQGLQSGPTDHHDTLWCCERSRHCLGASSQPLRRVECIERDRNKCSELVVRRIEWTSLSATRTCAVSTGSVRQPVARRSHGGVESRPDVRGRHSEPHHHLQDTFAERRDDSGAIQAALNSAPAGQVVMLGPGTFVVNNLLLIHRPITLRGSGAGVTTLFKTNGAKPRTSTVSQRHQRHIGAR